MNAIQASDYANRLLSAHGDKAIVEVSQKMRDCEAAGKTDEASNWQKVRDAIYRMRGPIQA